MPNGKKPRDYYLGLGSGLIKPDKPARTLQRIKANLPAQIPGVGELFLASELGVEPSPYRGIGLLFKLANSVLSSVGLGVEAEIATETPGGGEPGRPMDVTDPRIDPGEVELSPIERRIRAMRRLGVQSRQFLPERNVEDVQGIGPGILEPGTSAPTSGQAIELGLVAPPKNDAEKVIDFMADLLPSLVGGGAVFIGTRMAALGGARQLATTRAGQQLLLKGAQFIAKRGPGARGVLTQGQMQARIAAAEQTIPQFLADAAGELFAGAAIGAGEELRRQATDTKTDYTAIAKGTLYGLAFGATLGTGINIGVNSYRFVKAARSMSDLLHAGLLKPEVFAPQGIDIRLRGLQVGNKRAVAYKQDGTIQWIDAQGKFTSEPTPDEMRKWAGQLVQDFQASKSEAESVVGKAKLQAKDESVEQTGTLSNFEQRTIQAYEAQYMPTAIGMRTRFGSHSPEILENQADLLEAWALHAKISDHARWAALGQARALRRSAGANIPTVPGLTLDEEAAAQNIVKTFTKAEVDNFVAQQTAAGNIPIANRVAELAQLGIPDPRVTAQDVLTFLDAVNVNTTRGITRGSIVVLPDGKIGEVVQARFGKASIKFDDPALAPQVVNIDEVLPVPEAGKLVKLRDGRVGKITEIQLADRKAQFRQAGKRRQDTIDFSDIELYGHSSRANRELEGLVRSATKGETEPKVRAASRTRKVDKRTGEPVVVERTGQATSEVTSTRSGKKRTVKNKDLGNSSRVARSQQKGDLPSAPVSEEVAAQEVMITRLAQAAGIELDKPIREMSGDEIRALIKRLRC